MTTIEVVLKDREVFSLTPDIHVTILNIDRGRCRIGIEAPDHIRILRSELVEEVQCGTLSENATVNTAGSVNGAVGKQV